ncbi:MAG TPA: lipoyl(octanoyl) transferase LipB [Vicinamibacteria bacterium]|nr:lipoyl(octanoyl) transferase LipB [Vicinamibacteria bacterium]
MSDPCWCVELGTRDFDDTWGLQKQLAAARQRGDVPDVLLLVEHPPTYTLGRSGRSENLIADRSKLAELGAELVVTDRGGDVTFHGPGQIVGYPIVDLKRWHPDVHRYLRALEEVNIRTISEFGVAGFRKPGFTGVWHARGKLVAIGVRVSRWVTSHGFALNVGTKLDYFNQIVPCGIVGSKVSSMEDVLGEPVDPALVRKALARFFGAVFSRVVVEASETELVSLASP